MRLRGRIEKTWGYEDIFISNDEYCGKYLVFNHKGDKTSMHFHKEKKETWKVERGMFCVRFIDTDDAEVLEAFISAGDVWTNDPLVPHQLEALEDDSCVLEISTADSVEDNYRVYR